MKIKLTNADIYYKYNIDYINTLIYNIYIYIYKQIINNAM